MITLFATPKNFSDIFKNIQLNALRSWRALSSEIQIIIFGDSTGSKEAAEEIKAEYIPSIKCSSKGTPILSDLFIQAEKIAKFPILTFINADIILPNNFLSSIQITSSAFNKFLMIGHRWDMDVEYGVNFNDSKDIKNFWKRVSMDSRKHANTGIDYFVYRKNQWKNIPHFIIGRPGYDNWLIWKARRTLVPIIDVTEDVQVVHQNHHFNFHNLKSDPKIIPEEEGKLNRELHGEKILNILDATYQLIDGKVLLKKDKGFRIRNLHRLPIIFPEFAYPIILYRKFYKRFVL